MPDSLGETSSPSSRSPDSNLAISSGSRRSKSNFPIQVTRIVEPVDDHHCVVQASITGGPRVPWPLTVLAGRMAQRAVDADYHRLQGLLEA